MGDEIAGQVLLLSHSNILFSGVLATDLHQRYAVREMVLRLIALAVLFAAYVLPGCVGLDNVSPFSARCSDGCSDDLIFSCPIHQPLILNARPDIATVPQLVVTFAAISVAFERWLRSKILNTRITAKTSAMPLIESNLCSW
jgi:hypothetical protein